MPSWEADLVLDGHSADALSAHPDRLNGIAYASIHDPD
jgi:hypothetical protein